MKTLLSSALLLMLSFIAFAQEAKFFEPYKNTDLRLPSVPLILNDPFISFWSPYNKLNEGYTTHWADIRKTYGRSAACRRHRISLDGQAGNSRPRQAIPPDGI